MIWFAVEIFQRALGEPLTAAARGGRQGIAGWEAGNG